jgi:hypothetical protein
MAPSDGARVAAVQAAARAGAAGRRLAGGGGGAAFPADRAAHLTAGAWNLGCLHVRWARPAAAVALMAAATALLPCCPPSFALRAEEMAAALGRVEADAAGAVPTPGRATEGGRSGSGVGMVMG